MTGAQRRETEKSWGTRIADRREQLSLSQAALAEASGLTQQTISKVENNEITPRISTMEALAKALGATVEELFPWGSRPKAAS